MSTDNEARLREALENIGTWAFANCETEKDIAVALEGVRHELYALAAQPQQTAPAAFDGRVVNSELEASSTEARRESPLSSVHSGEGSSPRGQTPTALAVEIVDGLEKRGYMDLQFNRDDSSAAKEFVSEVLEDAAGQATAPRPAQWNECWGGGEMTTGMLSADAIAAIFTEHTTSYASRTDQGWDWSCSCGEKGYSADHEFCQRLTRGHWANVIAAAYAAREREWLKKLEGLEAAAKKLLAKLDQVEKDTAGIFVMAHVHGQDYKGANWAEEYKRVSALLAEKDSTGATSAAKRGEAT